jgi:hypothetical protein
MSELTYIKEQTDTGRMKMSSVELTVLDLGPIRGNQPVPIREILHLSKDRLHTICQRVALAQPLFRASETPRGVLLIPPLERQLPVILRH